MIMMLFMSIYIYLKTYISAVRIWKHWENSHRLNVRFARTADSSVAACPKITKNLCLFLFFPKRAQLKYNYQKKKIFNWIYFQQFKTSWATFFPRLHSWFKNLKLDLFKSFDFIYLFFKLLSKFKLDPNQDIINNFRELMWILKT